MCNGTETLDIVPACSWPEVALYTVHTHTHPVSDSSVRSWNAPWSEKFRNVLDGKRLQTGKWRASQTRALSTGSNRSRDYKVWCITHTYSFFLKRSAFLNDLVYVVLFGVIIFSTVLSAIFSKYYDPLLSSCTLFIVRTILHITSFLMGEMITQLVAN